MSICGACVGKGKLDVKVRTTDTWMQVNCPECNGTGTIPLKKRIVKKAKTKC